MSVAPPHLRVCIVAENAATTLGGEAILPFHYFRLLRARGVDAWLCVHERCREELLALFPHDHDRLVFVGDHWLQKLFFRVGKLLPSRVSEASFGLANQMLTQKAQREAIHFLTRTGCVVHQPIPVAPRFPSLMYDLGCPVVIGPLNGGMQYPPAFRKSESWASRAAIVAARSLTNSVNTWLPGKQRATVVLVANERTRDALPQPLHGTILLMVENGVDLSQWRIAETTSKDAPARFVFAGRLVDWKRVDIAIEALRRVDSAALDIVGDGPMRGQWQQLATSAGVADRVRFHGWLTQPQAAQVLANARALVLPSVYESGGAVVLEAMAAGKPVIATAWGGPCDYIDNTCGLLIEPTSPQALIEGFAVAMQQLIASPATAQRMGTAGRRRVVEHFDWEKKVDAMLDIYRMASSVEGPE